MTPKPDAQMPDAEKALQRVSELLSHAEWLGDYDDHLKECLITPRDLKAIRHALTSHAETESALKLSANVNNKLVSELADLVKRNEQMSQALELAKVVLKAWKKEHGTDPHTETALMLIRSALSDNSKSATP